MMNKILYSVEDCVGNVFTRSMNLLDDYQKSGELSLIDWLYQLLYVRLGQYDTSFSEIESDYLNKLDNFLEQNFEFITFEFNTKLDKFCQLKGAESYYASKGISKDEIHEHVLNEIKTFNCNYIENDLLSIGRFRIKYESKTKPKVREYITKLIEKIIYQMIR